MAEAAAAFEGASSRVREARHKLQPGHNVQFFVEEKVGMSTSVVKGGLEEVLLQVIGDGELGDAYAMMNGK